MNKREGSHRFFHAMVVMGGGLALKCGGVTVERHAGDEPSDASSVGTGGVGGGSGGVPASGGVTSGSGTGAPPPAAGGASVALDAGVAPWFDSGSLACPSTQWTCSEAHLSCSGPGLALPDDCWCDPTRPRGACAPGETLVCRKATSDADGNALSGVVAFECTCVPTSGDCGLCSKVFPNAPQYDCQSNDPADAPVVLCGCAIVYLR